MRTWQAAVCGIASVSLLAACGGGGFEEESVDTILEESQKDMQELSSVRIEGEVTKDGDPVTIDMQVTSSGDCDGTLGIQGGTAQIRSLDGKTWMKPDAAFWEASAGESAALVQGVVGDKWVVLPEEEGDFGEFCDIDELMSDVYDDEDDTNDAEPEKGGTAEVGGQQAVEVTGETDDGEPSTIWIAVDDPHHLLKMEITEGDEPGEMTFSDFDEELDVEAPADDEVVDLENLGG